GALRPTRAGHCHCHPGRNGSRRLRRRSHGQPELEDRLERDWWPRLRRQYPEPAPGVAESLSMQERFALRAIHHPWVTQAEVARHYPSHLHINMLPRLQGRGFGRQLISALLTRLRDLGSPGVHLHVGEANQRAVGFYRHLGFVLLPRTETQTFGMKLTA